MILFNFSHKYRFTPELILRQSQTLEVLNSAKILGVVISSDLKWAKNTDFIVSKAMKRIWTLRRLRKLGFSDNFILDVYQKEIRTLLEYAVQVWNGALTKTDSDKIEKVQKIVMKFLLRKKYQSYSEAYEKFRIKKLSDRRHKLCLKFAIKEFENSTTFFKKISTQKRRAVSKKKFVHEPKTRTKRHFSSSYVFLTRLFNDNYKP